MARLSCGLQWTRWILLVLNIIFLLIGCSILGSGIYIKINGNRTTIIVLYNVAQAMGDEAIQRFGRMMIIIGAVISSLAFFGYFGVLCRNRILLYLYSMVLSMIIIFQFISLIITLSLHNDLWESYDLGFRKVFQRAYRTNQTDIIRIISKFEQDFKCCGVDSLTDYVKLDYQIPLSCYPNQILQDKPFNQGCAEAIVIWIWTELPIIAGIFGSILLIEIFGVISALVLGVAIAHPTNTDFYYKM